MCSGGERAGIEDAAADAAADGEGHVTDDSQESSSSSDSSSAISHDDKQLTATSQRLDVDHMYSDQSQDDQTRTRTTVIRDIVKVIVFGYLVMLMSNFFSNGSLNLRIRSKTLMSVVEMQLAIISIQ